MRIANPIYDVVFKYMMEDLKVAKTFIAAIIGEDVEELDFCPQEYADFQVIAKGNCDDLLYHWPYE